MFKLKISTLILGGSMLILNGFGGNVSSLSAQAQTAAFKAVPWFPYHVGLEKARAAKKHAFIDFYATWCSYCNKMDRDVFTNYRVRKALADYFIPIRLTEKSNTMVLFNGKWVTEDTVLSSFALKGFPSMLFLDANGKKIYMLPGYLEPDDMYAMLSFIGTDSYTKMNFLTYKAKFLAK